MSAGIDVSQFSGLARWTTRPCVDCRSTTGRPAAAHAHIPPARLTASKPHARSDSVTAAERPPERHTTTIRRSRGSSAWRCPHLAHRHQHGAGRVLRLPLVGFAHVEEQRAGVEQRLRRAGADLRASCRRRSVAAPVEVGSPAPSHAVIAAEQVRDIGEASVEQHAGGDLGAVAALAVHDDGRRLVESGERIGEHGERDLAGAGQRARRGLAGTAHVDDLQVRARGRAARRAARSSAASSSRSGPGG